MNERHRPEDAFSTPWDVPLYGRFPATLRNAEILTLVYRSDPAAISALLPPPLERTSDLVLIHIYNMHDAPGSGRYGECNVMVGARLNRKASGGYTPYLFLDSDTGLAHGREVHGQPKMLARPRIELRRGLLVGTVERNGIDIITGTMSYRRKAADLDDLRRKVEFVVNLNYKVIPHIDGTIAIRQITSRKFADLKVHECWTGPCTVELRPNALAPVYKLPVLEMQDGYYWRADFTLVEGQILHDYLKEPRVQPKRKR
jgi:acetoacetate decarboxylase